MSIRWIPIDKHVYGAIYQEHMDILASHGIYPKRMRIKLGNDE